jgi:hypothetical protein
MRDASTLVMALLGALAMSVPGLAQESGPGRACPMTTCPTKPACESRGAGTSWCRWAIGCFPRHGCPDDYCPNPYPRQCWPPYPPFYRCVPAGDCTHPPCVGVGYEKLTWWWLPTLRALRDALWCQP